MCAYSHGNNIPKCIVLGKMVHQNVYITQNYTKMYILGELHTKMPITFQEDF